VYNQGFKGMRVLIISSPNPYGRGGEIRSYNILMNISDKVNIDLITDLNNDIVINELRNRVDEIYRVRCSSNHETCIANIVKLATNLRKEDYDLIVSQSEHPRYALSAFAIAKILRRPWTAIVNSFIYICPLCSSELSLTRFTRNKITLDMLNKTLVHLVSRAVQFELSRRGFGFINYEVLEVPVGIDWDVINKVRAESISKEYDIAFMGVLSSEKGIYDIAYAVYILKKKLNRDIKAVLIGDFSSYTEKMQYFSILSKLGLQPNMIFKGYLTGEEKYREMLKAKIFVFPSKIDVLSISILEALALGLPVITWDLPHSREFTTNAVIKVNSFAKFIEVLEYLLTNDDTRNTSRNVGIEWAKHYTWRNAAQSEYKAYLRTIEWWLSNA